MPQVINTNVASLNSQRNLNVSQNSLSTALQRLSSGLRINSAKDDAAGLAISERMSAQIRGLNQAARNANDGISLAQTAEGALTEVGNNLQRIRELAVQSANATNSASDRAALQAEVAQLTAEITRVAGQTQFNGLNLLDGSFASQNFQIGANANQTISVSQIGDARASALGSNVLSTGGTHMGQAIAAGATVPAGAAAVAAGGNFTLTTAQGGTTAAIAYAVSAGANGIAAAINSAGTDVGLSAVATNSATLGNLASAGTVSLTLNGQAISANVASTGDLSALAAAINGVAGTTGVSASFANPSNLSEITLSTTDGRDIQILDFNNSGATKTVDIKGINGVAVELTGGTTTDSTRVVGNVDVYSSKGAITAANASAEAFSTSTSSFAAVASVSVASAQGAQSAIRVLDEALQQINSSRGELGALQNRFQSTITSLQTTSENLSASRSRIQDADFASETAALTRAQILQQAGVAMLAQANALPNNVLSLLR